MKCSLLICSGKPSFFGTAIRASPSATHAAVIPKMGAGIGFQRCVLGSKRQGYALDCLHLALILLLASLLDRILRTGRDQVHILDGSQKHSIECSIFLLGFGSYFVARPGERRRGRPPLPPESPQAAAGLAPPGPGLAVVR